MKLVLLMLGILFVGQRNHRTFAVFQLVSSLKFFWCKPGTQRVKGKPTWVDFTDNKNWPGGYLLVWMIEWMSRWWTIRTVVLGKCKYRWGHRTVNLTCSDWCHVSISLFEIQSLYICSCTLTSNQPPHPLVLYSAYLRQPISSVRNLRQIPHFLFWVLIDRHSEINAKILKRFTI